MYWTTETYGSLYPLPNILNFDVYLTTIFWSCAWSSLAMMSRSTFECVHSSFDNLVNKYEVLEIVYPYLHNPQTYKTIFLYTNSHLWGLPSWSIDYGIHAFSEAKFILFFDEQYNSLYLYNNVTFSVYYTK